MNGANGALNTSEEDTPNKMALQLKTPDLKKLKRNSSNDEFAALEDQFGKKRKKTRKNRAEKMNYPDINSDSINNIEGDEDMHNAISKRMVPYQAPASLKPVNEKFQKIQKDIPIQGAQQLKKTSSRIRAQNNSNNNPSPDMDIDYPPALIKQDRDYMAEENEPLLVGNEAIPLEGALPLP